MKKTVIILTGKARSGKDTVAEYMKEFYEDRDDRVLIAHYADALKHVCKSFFNWDGVKDEHGRTLLQMVGTNKIRDLYGKNFWVDFMWTMLSASSNTWDVAIIPDGRYENELRRPEYIKFPAEYDVVVKTVRVIRNGDNNLTEAQKAHSSENEADGVTVDHVINNDRGIKELFDKVNIISSIINDESPIKDKFFIGDVIKTTRRTGGGYAIITNIDYESETAFIIMMDGRAGVINTQDIVKRAGSAVDELLEVFEKAELLLSPEMEKHDEQD